MYVSDSKDHGCPAKSSIQSPRYRETDAKDRNLIQSLRRILKLDGSSKGLKTQHASS